MARCYGAWLLVEGARRGWVYTSTPPDAGIVGASFPGALIARRDLRRAKPERIARRDPSPRAHHTNCHSTFRVRPKLGVAGRQCVQRYPNLTPRSALPRSR